MNEEPKSCASLTAADRPLCPLCFCRMRAACSPPPSRVPSQPPPQLRYDVSEPRGCCFLSSGWRLTRLSEKPTQEPNHDGSGGVSGSLVDERRICSFCVISAGHVDLRKPERPAPQIHERRPQSRPITSHPRISLQRGLVKLQTSSQQRPTARVALARAPAAANRAPRLK